MAGDFDITERAVLGADAAQRGAAPTWPGVGQTLHRYGRVSVVAVPGGPAAAAPGPEPGDTDGLTEVERLGLAALRLRESTAYRTAKARRLRDAEPWDMPDCTEVVPQPGPPTASATAAAPTSSYLEGTVAVGIVIVQGPTSDLQFSNDEILKVVAEVQNGLSFYPTTNPIAGISFAYDIQNVAVTVAADPNAPDLEALWRNPAMAAMGYSADWAGVGTYVEDLRTRFGTRWTYCGFFTKYPLSHFAYASIGGPRVVMQYANDGWGPDNIDRVFAHETGHIFGCPDEYANSKCDCGGSWGRYGLVNGNCENCAGDGGVACLMKLNTFAVCEFTPGHLGWSPQLLVRNYGYSAGGWRVEKHPRLLGDITADGRLDIVGFGDAGVYVSPGHSDGRFETPRRVIDNFGYEAGGWRVEKHPRFLADVTGEGRADIVGFGDAGVWVALSNGDGTFGAMTMPIANFGYNAGGWRVEKHPRFLADITGDGRADIVGFGDAGVWVALSNGDGTFQPMTLAINNFGYNAGGWRVEKHPRFLADTTGDGRADIVGFGDAGVWVALSNGDGTFQPMTLAINNFGYNAGGWRVEKHPRFLADVTGDGRADVVGFGDAGVWVALSNGDGTFQPMAMPIANFAYNAGGWRVEKHPRFLADTTGDGRADVVGFGDAGVWVSRSLGAGLFDPPGRVIANFGYDAGGWRVEKHPRFVANITGDGKADVLGFGDAGVWVNRT
ncbi:FG-GAP-like repeat-containing protein [Streptomyces aquilus]|nr:FG-GAP-like repeat-containing protein [Streptomyces aquilus]